jgi:hypothetical protein
VFTATPTHIGVGEYDVAAQIEVSNHWWVIDGELKTFSSPHRYVWPSELDLMARLAGMTLRALERLAPRTLHEREPQPHLRVAEIDLADAPRPPRRPRQPLKCRSATLTDRARTDRSGQVGLLR